MPRIASPLTLTATLGAAAGATALAMLMLGATGHAETLPAATKPLPTFVAAQHMVPVTSAEAPRDGEGAAAQQERPARVARVIYPSPYTNPR